MRLIDADNLTAFLGDERATLHKEQQSFKAMSEIEFSTRDYMLLHLQYIIDNAPTFEYTFDEAFQKTVCDNRLYCPARPQGRWIQKCDDNFDWYECSCCGYGDEGELQEKPWFKFCPSCGLRMKGEKNE